MSDSDDHNRFPPECRVRGGRDYRRVYARRCRVSDERVTILACENGLTYPRLGMAVSRKVGKATVRNRWKRLLREAFRLARRQLPGGLDLIVIPRPGAEPELAALLDSFPRLAGRLTQRLRRSGSA